MSRNYYVMTNNEVEWEEEEYCILKSTTSNGNITIIERIQMESNISQMNDVQTRNQIDELEEYIETDCAIACVDAYVKENSFGGHIYITEKNDVFNEQWSIGSNTCSFNQYVGEARTLLELFRRLKPFTSIDNLGGIRIYSDNKKLVNIINKPDLRYSDLANKGRTVIK